MLPYSFMAQGTYTNGATLAAVSIPLTDRPDWFFVKDLTNWGDTTAIAPVYAEWFSSMANGSFLSMDQTVTTNALASNVGTSGGFTFYNTAQGLTFTGLATTGISNTTFVVLMASTAGIAVGDIVRVTGPTGMLQIGGMTFAVTAVSANTSITLGYMASAVSAGLTIGAAATGGTITKIIPNRFYPKQKFVAYVTQATQAVVYFTQPNDFTVGEMVDFTIPAAYGMTQLSYLTALSRGPARVLSVTNSATVSSITIDVDTTGMTAFVYPSSANFALGVNGSPATCYPAGAGVVPLNGSATVPASPPGTNLAAAFDNRNQYIMQIGTSACGVASATMQWFAFKADTGAAVNA